MIDDINHLIDTLLKVEALHAGATTPGERDAAGAAIERIKKKLAQYVEIDLPKEIHCTFSNLWSKQLFCALARRYDLQPYRYHRQRYTTVMLKVPERFLNEVLWPEFEGINDVLKKYLDDITTKIISEAIYEGSTEEEVREQPLIGSEAKPVPAPSKSPEADAVESSPTRPNAPAKAEPAVVVPRPNPVFIPGKSVSRNQPCPCGSGLKFKRCCGKK